MLAKIKMGFYASIRNHFLGSRPGMFGSDIFDCPLPLLSLSSTLELGSHGVEEDEEEDLLMKKMTQGQVQHFQKK